MNTLFNSSRLAAVNEVGILQHDVLGIIAVGVLLLLGVLLYKRQKQWVAPHGEAPQESEVSPLFGRIQLWVVYLVVLATAIWFFFGYPRATSEDAQPDPGQTTNDLRTP